MSDLETRGQVLKPSPDPWIRRTIESEIKYMQEILEIIKTVKIEKPGPDPWKWMDAIEKPDPTPWRSIGAIANYVPANKLEQIGVQAIKSEIKYMQEDIAIRKMIYDELIAKPGPTPWKMMDAIAKPGPTPWKMIGAIASYVPAYKLGQIEEKAMKSEIEYVQEGIAIRKMIYDELGEKAK